MKKLPLKWLYSLLFLFSSLTLGGCDLVVDVFEYGIWIALILIAIIAALVYLFARMFRRK